MNMKPTVLYTELLYCAVGGRAFVVPLDHPSHLVSNGTPAITSTVMKYDQDSGEFETKNTLYKRAT